MYNRNELLEQLRTIGAELAGLASYAEIIGAIRHNNAGIRKNCDLFMEINALIKHMDENKRFKVKLRRNSDEVILPVFEQIDGKEYNFTFGWDEGNGSDETVWLPVDDHYPQDAPRQVSSNDLEEMKPIESSS